MKQEKWLWLAAGVGAGILARQMVRRQRMIDLNGKVVLITGGSRGLGFQMAKAFASEGCRLVLCARDERELARADRELSALGAQVLAIPCDVTSRVDAHRAIEESTRYFGRIDILVNDAGIIQVGPAQSMNHRDFQEAMDVNFWGVLNMTLAVLPQMRDRKSGRIVNITSVGGRVPVPHLLPYSCSKFATTALSEGLRAELARDNVLVTTILPGTMRTGSHKNAFVKGHQAEEFVNFSLSATLPLISMSAESAARQVVEAVRQGDAERVISPPAQCMTAFHALFPGATADLFGLINTYILPEPEGGQMTATRGAHVQKRLRSRWLNLLMTLGEKAARRLHQSPGPNIAAQNGRDVSDAVEAPMPLT